jgi:hypothetical protein
MIKNRIEWNVTIGLSRGAHSFVDNFDKSANLLSLILIILSICTEIVEHPSVYRQQKRLHRVI